MPNSLVIIAYLSATVAAIRLFRGPRRWIAVLATVMCSALVPFAGVVLVIPAAIAVIALLYRYRYGREPAPANEEPVFRRSAADHGLVPED